MELLNLGCGKTFHPDWHNVDIVSSSPEVQACNFLKGLPFADGRFQGVYHSHVLEHVPRWQAEDFIRECYRVLQPGGVLRIVVPDLENVIREYLRHLQVNLDGSSPQSEARYDWIMVELFEQMVRRQPSGEMYKFACQLKELDPAYLFERIGPPDLSPSRATQRSWWQSLKDMLRRLRRWLRRHLTSVACQLGSFHLSGEMHMWMYDRFSLARLLRRCGFTDIQARDAFDSGIPDWGRYELDVCNHVVRFPTSLFMEARRPQ